MTFPVRSRPATFHTAPLKRNSVQNVGVKIVTLGLLAPSWMASLGVMGAFESLASVFLGSLFRKKKKAPFQMIAKNVAFEKASVITVIELPVLLYQHHRVLWFCMYECLDLGLGLG